MTEKDTGNWNDYAKLVLKELETLATSIASLAHEIQGIKSELAIIKERESKVDSLQAWREKMSETASPTQFANCMKDVEDLKNFKVKAVTIFIVIQSLVALAVSILHVLK